MNSKRNTMGQSMMSAIKAAIFGNTFYFLDFGNLFVKQLLDKCSNVLWKDVFESWLIVIDMRFDYITKID